MLAVPVYLLYELGILMSRVFSAREPEEAQEVTSDNI
jgi:Sec-independent protein secretion pathway component TatC